ncbi:hypothetical protein JTB14_029329 [Gonioctena quinquepunctata]|nr:hypothetical protein JTB14_029329 [Gonioctena quinquepunctata]
MRGSDLCSDSTYQKALPLPYSNLSCNRGGNQTFSRGYVEYYRPPGFNDGGFNAKVRRVGAFGLGTRNHRGQMLANFLSREKNVLHEYFLQKATTDKVDMEKP